MIRYSIGDIHGSKTKMDAAIDWIERDAGSRPAHIRFHGDYIDRGPDSKGVVDSCIALQDSAGPNRAYTFLKGNHEDMMVAALTYGENSIFYHSWMENGGVETLESYNIIPYTGQQDELPKAHLDFFASLKLWDEDEQYIYVHAGIQPIARPVMADQDEEKLMWIRHDFLRSTVDFGKIVVHGHTVVTFDPARTGPKDQPVVTSNRINLDTGAVFGGKLTVARFDGTSVHFEQF